MGELKNIAAEPSDVRLAVQLSPQDQKRSLLNHRTNEGVITTAQDRDTPAAAKDRLLAFYENGREPLSWTLVPSPA